MRCKRLILASILVFAALAAAAPAQSDDGLLSNSILTAANDYGKIGRPRKRFQLAGKP